MTSTRRLHVVIVAYKAARLLEKALDCLGPDLPVTVVDNSSAADVAAVVRAHGAEYLDPGNNLGFGSGANIVLQRLLGGDPADILLLNPDATFSGQDALTLQTFLYTSPAPVGILSPRLVSPCGNGQREAWPFPSPLRCWAEALGLGRLTHRADFVVGTVMLIRWKALCDVGLFDERFFMYAEETDWQRRAHEAGWGRAVCREVVATHIGGGTSTNAQRREELFHAGTETYIRKWFGPGGWAAYRSASIVGAATRALVLPTGRRRASARNRAALYIRGPRLVAGLEGHDDAAQRAPSGNDGELCWG